MAATDSSGDRLELLTYTWLQHKTAGHRKGQVQRTGAAHNGTRGDGGRDMEYTTLRDEIVRVDCKVAHSSIGVHRVSAFSGRLESTAGCVTGLLVSYPADFSEGAKEWLLQKRARTFLGAQLEMHDVVLISGESLLMQVEAMQNLNRNFQDELRKLEEAWSKVDGLPTPLRTGPVENRKRSRESGSSSEDASDSSIGRSNESSVGRKGESPALRVSPAACPKATASDLETPFEGMHVWLNLCDWYEDRPPENGTYEGTITKIKDGRNRGTIVVKIERAIVCARPPAAARAISGPQRPSCAVDGSMIELNSLTVHELWTVDGKKRVAHPYSEHLKRQLRPHAWE